MESNAFTLNVPSPQYLVETDYLGMVSGIDADKFSVSGLTAVRSELVNAPYVKEFQLIMECRVIQSVDIGSHTQFIGQIVDVKSDDAVLGDDGFPVAEKVNPIISSACNRSYFALGDFLAKTYSPGMELLN